MKHIIEQLEEKREASWLNHRCVFKRLVFFYVMQLQSFLYCLEQRVRVIQSSR